MSLKYRKQTRAPKEKQKEIDQDIVNKMFDHLKGKVHMANQNGLQSLQKILNELIFMFII